MPVDSTLRQVSLDGKANFTELAEARRELGEDVRPHRDSINFFASSHGFHRVASAVPDHVPEPATPGATSGDALKPGAPPTVLPLGNEERITGVTTALTCFESLSDAIVDREAANPREFTGLSGKDMERLVAFAANALAQTEAWRSEGAARRYCIVRAVAPMVRLVPSGTDVSPLIAVVREVWDHVHLDRDRCGIYEVSIREEPDSRSIDGPQSSPDHPRQTGPMAIPLPVPPETNESRYPPNAFLTYWGIRSLQAIPELLPEIADRLNAAVTWLYGVIGREVALQYADVHSRDPQQLAWAICGVLASDDTLLADRSENTTAIIEAGLKAFFAQQLPDGTWETGRALFHYPDAGNAYCYIFETLAELITLSLDGNLKASGELRRMLVPYLGQLLGARSFLKATQRPLGEPSNGRVGWSSGHHPHRTSPESWATATAYRFLQALRRLAGWEARQRAASELKARRVLGGQSVLVERGQTWDAGKGSAGDLLASLFVNPQLAHPVEVTQLDPDRPLLDKSWARSALLFGPPGTGKTNLARAVAGWLKWEFIEITPADFLDQGTELVSARADQIFRQLLEIDSAVVLFDEIDELIRERTGTTDMLGRFFTTTMLPRLARLWDARKLIFFVNTNSIRRVDPAIRRSQRFDAAIFVLPPDYDRKVACIPSAAREFVSRNSVYQVLSDYPGSGITSEDAKAGWLAFLRFDQLSRLSAGVFSSPESLRAELERLGEEMFSDWALVNDVAKDVAEADAADERLTWMIEAYRAEARNQRVDPTRLRLIVVPIGDPPEWLDRYGASGFGLWRDAGTIPSGVLDGAGRLDGL